MELSWRSLSSMYSNLLSKFLHLQSMKIRRYIISAPELIQALAVHYVVVQSFNLCLASQQRPFSAD